MHPLSGAVLFSGPYPEDVPLVLLVLVLQPLALFAFVGFLVHLIRPSRKDRQANAPGEEEATG